MKKIVVSLNGKRYALKEDFSDEPVPAQGEAQVWGVFSYWGDAYDEHLERLFSNAGKARRWIEAYKAQWNHEGAGEQYSVHPVKVW